MGKTGAIGRALLLERVRGVRESANAEADEGCAPAMGRRVGRARAGDQVVQREAQGPHGGRMLEWEDAGGSIGAQKPLNPNSMKQQFTR